MNHQNLNSSAKEKLIAIIFNRKLIAAIIILGTFAFYIYLQKMAPEAKTTASSTTTAPEKAPPPKPKYDPSNYEGTGLTHEEVVQGIERMNTCSAEREQYCAHIAWDDFENNFKCIEQYEEYLSEHCRNAVKDYWHFRLKHEGAKAAKQAQQ